MKSHWKIPSEDLRVFTYPACQHTVTKEVAASGAYGEIWVHSNTTCAAIVKSPKVMGKVNKILGTDIKITQGEEAVIKFPKDLVKKVGKALRISTHKNVQLRYFNSF